MTLPNWQGLERTRTRNIRNAIDITYDLGITNTNVLLTGAVGDGITNDAPAFQAAHDGLPSTGGTIVVPRSPNNTFYLLSNDWWITKPNIHIVLEGGAWIRRDILGGASGDPSSTTRAAILVGGTSLASTTTKTLNAATAGERFVTTTVAADAGTFAFNDWVIIRDNLDGHSNLSVPQAEWIHMEINRVHDINATTGVVNLLYPLHQSYSTAPVQIYKILPTENCTISGPGKIESWNGSTGLLANGGHGIKFNHAINGRVIGVETVNCYNSGIHAGRSRGILVDGNLMRDPPDRFDSKGYGFTCHSCSDIVVSNNQCFRHRHNIDISTFSVKSTVLGNRCSGSTHGNIITHPNVEFVDIIGNIIDGAYGPNDAGGGVVTDYGTATSGAAGINIDVVNRHINVTNNIIRNCRSSGIYIDTDQTEYIRIADNLIENTGISGSGTPAGINAMEHDLSDGSWPGTDWRGWVIEGNQIINNTFVGIYIGISNAIVQNNIILNCNSVGIWARPARDDPTSGATNIKIHNNTIRNCKNYGIGVADSARTSAVISDSIITNNYISNITATATAYGIYLLIDGLNNNNIYNNIIQNLSGVTDSQGIYIKGSDNKVIHNTIEDTQLVPTTRSGVVLSPTAIETKVAYNRCLALTYAGIRIYSGSTNTSLLDNYFLNCLNTVVNAGTGSFNLGLSRPIRNITATGAITPTIEDYSLNISANGATRIVNLPVAATTSGRIFCIRLADNVLTDDLTITPNAGAGDNIISAATASATYTMLAVVGTNESITIQSNGVNSWIILNKTTL